MRLHFLLLSASIALLGHFQPSAGKNPCNTTSLEGKPVVCTGCSKFKYCHRGQLSEYDVFCGPSAYCHEDLLGASESPCSAEVPARCADFNTPAAPPTPVRDAVEMTCTGVGIYPDANNCNNYHYCPGAGQLSWLQVCPPDYVFQYTSSAESDRFPCKQQKTAADCVSVDCTGTASAFNPFGSNKLFYVLCSNDVASVFKCPEGATFDGTKCVHSCTEEGLFANTADSSKYFWCYYEDGTLISSEKICPAGKKFDQSKIVCI